MSDQPKKADVSKENESKLFPSDPLPGFKEAEGKNSSDLRAG